MKVRIRVSESVSVPSISRSADGSVELLINTELSYEDIKAFIGDALSDEEYLIFYTLWADDVSKREFIPIEGTTDFIFGKATVLFENCTIHSKKNSYITAASTPEGVNYGFVFKNCKLTANENTTEVYLGRPWRIYAKTVFMNCDLGSHIKVEGWHNWNKPEAEKTAFYAEFENTGKGFNPKSRVGWSHQLKKSEAKKYTIENILGSKQKDSIAQWYLNYKFQQYYTFVLT